jgi:hypothetical protein
MNEHVARRISLAEADGTPVSGEPFAFEGGLGSCVVGGLEPGAAYRWNVTDGTEPAVQEWDEAVTDRPGEWSFVTSTASKLPTPMSVDDCRAAAADVLYDTQCEEFDSGCLGADSGQDSGDDSGVGA